MDRSDNTKTMKAAIALLSDYHVQNVARKMVYAIHQRAPIQFFGSLLPAHVSLKQPFIFEDLDILEAWFDSFGSQVSPFRVELDHVYYDQWDDYAIVGLRVRETPTLRGLHNQINRELSRIVTNPSAPHDGDAYRFHLTIELGKVDAINPFKEFYESLTEKSLKLSFTAKHLALFIYAGRTIEPGWFICYKVLSLTARS
jgi:2'-5' RNA ligase